MSEKVRDQVETPGAHRGIHTARNMADAANSEQSLEGYAAINGLSEEDEIARVAHQFFEERQRGGTPGSSDGDWFRAEEVRRGRMATNR
ncbi:MAG: hypothetical protein SGI92_01085 [Bryobacteraceae bacterium]|nr:hypothetical protein [Bryobacteraceae bacterium]